MDIAVIGGADGPTTVVLTSSPLAWAAGIILSLALGVAIVLVLIKTVKDRLNEDQDQEQD